MIYPYSLAYLNPPILQKVIDKTDKHCNIVRYSNRHPIFRYKQNAYALQALLLVLYSDPRDTTPVLTPRSQPRHYDATPSGPLSLPRVVLGSIGVGCLHVIILTLGDLVKIRLRITTYESSLYYQAIYFFNERYRVPSTPLEGNRHTSISGGMVQCKWCRHFATSGHNLGSNMNLTFNASNAIVRHGDQAIFGWCTAI